MKALSGQSAPPVTQSLNLTKIQFRVLRAGQEGKDIAKVVARNWPLMQERILMALLKRNLITALNLTQFAVTSKGDEAVKYMQRMAVKWHRARS